jgi:hypothetical protein
LPMNVRLNLSVDGEMLHALRSRSIGGASDASFANQNAGSPSLRVFARGFLC